MRIYALHTDPSDLTRSHLSGFEKKEDPCRQEAHRLPPAHRQNLGQTEHLKEVRGRRLE